MNKDFRVAVDYFTHPKTIKAERALGALASTAFLRLLAHAAVNKPSGVLTGMDAEDVAIAAHWDGDSIALVETWLRIGQLDHLEDGTLVIHDWQEHNGFAATAEKRSEAAKKANRIRWERVRDSESDPVESESDKTGLRHGQNRTPPSPSPSPSPNPDPTPTGGVGGDGADAPGVRSEKPETEIPFSEPLPEVDPQDPELPVLEEEIGPQADAPTPVPPPPSPPLELAQAWKRDPAFVAFWQAYTGPRKKSAANTYGVWRKHKLGAQALPVVLARLAEDQASEDWKKQGGAFIPAPEVWLNKRRWLDDPAEGVGVTAGSSNPYAAYPWGAELYREMFGRDGSRCPAAIAIQNCAIAWGVDHEEAERRCVREGVIAAANWAWSQRREVI